MRSRFPIALRANVALKCGYKAEMRCVLFCPHTDKDASLFARQAEILHAANIGRHARDLLVREFGEIGPGVEPGVVAVGEADAQGVAPDRVRAGDADMALLRGRRRVFAAMALGLGARAFNAQEFVRDRPLAAIVEPDQQFGARLVEAEFCREGSGAGQVRLLRRADVAGFVAEHDGDAVADREGEAGGAADQLVGFAVIGQRCARDRADQHFEETRVDARITCLSLVRVGLVRHVVQLRCAFCVAHWTYPPP